MHTAKGPNKQFIQIKNCGQEESIIDDEWIDVDLVIREVQTFRLQNFWRPDLYFENPAYAGNHMEVSGIKKSAGMTMIVFDTSGLYHVLIPYTVLKELDGLRRTEYEKLRTKVIRTLEILNEYSKGGCYYLHIENMFEASFGVREFGCQNNDDVILKCALLTTNRYRNVGVPVIFVTNDKSLAVKAVAHNIVTVDQTELIRLFVNNDTLEDKQPPSAGTSAQQIAHDFSRIVPIKHFHSKIKTNLQVLPNGFVRCPPPRFAPMLFTHPPAQQIFMQNNQFLNQNRFHMPSWGVPSTQFPQMRSPYSLQMVNGMVSNFSSFI
ncbi:hypothetical protein LOAG_01819 [Loa loa]|uniref:PIN domain-containing protein n=1 Tax=Loa loa TaxID=7209 RepID=A0A1S0UA05_LOALO|nr:hypothetical protein LOAG_01819 [Loa loa]EFO26668.2 hypothetical protein LOAG_01819 [Loa loa]